MNSAVDTRPVLDQVAALGKAHGCTPLYIRHNGKSQRAKAIHASLGSIDITAHMRSVLTLYRDPDETTRRILAHTKQHGRTAPSLNLNLVGATLDVATEDGFETIEEVRVDWDGLSDLTARTSMHGNASTGAIPRKPTRRWIRPGSFCGRCSKRGRCASMTPCPRQKGRRQRDNTSPRQGQGPLQSPAPTTGGYPRQQMALGMV